jgi:hypothetical protein
VLKSVHLFLTVYEPSQDEKEKLSHFSVMVKELLLALPKE